MPDDLTFSAKLPSSHASRHAWALEKYGHLLAEALCKDTSAEARKVEKLPQEHIPAHLVSLIMQKADPTQNKGMTAWLAGQYAQGKLRLEDLGTAHETLTMFRRYAQRLEPSQRDLGRYQNLAAVWDAVIRFANAEEQHISGKAQKALERDKAYAESRILRQDEDGFTIAVPLTEFAAKWWGKGTRWCTAAEKDNQFWHYHKQAPLMVIVIPALGERAKFQMWVSKKRVEFMDAADRVISDNLIEANWRRFKTVIQTALAQKGVALRWVPVHLRTEDLCRMAVVQNGHELSYVPERLRTEELCRIAVGQESTALQWVPNHLRTDDIYKIAVAQNGCSLGQVPIHLRTKAFCQGAVTQNGLALEYVPWDLRTDEICRIGVAQNGEALQWVPQHMCTPELCRTAVQQNGCALTWVPGYLRTDEMYRIAVAQNGWALAEFPEDLRTDEICRIALAQNGGALHYVPKTLLTDEMCRISVAQNGLALQNVPQALRTEEICEIAVVQDDRALVYVPKAMRDRISALIPPRVPAWDISLLDELVRFLNPASPSAPSGPPHA
jgi:hypothetical protein